LQQFKTLGRKLRHHHRAPGDVSPGSSQAIHEPGPYRITECKHDDGNAARCILRGLSGWGSRGRDDIGLQAKAFRSQGRKLLAATGCREIIDSNRLAIHIAQVSQALEKAVKSRRLRAKGSLRNYRGT